MEQLYKQLQLENQLCFSIYATSREITKVYKPLLDKLGVTYPQYLALLVLWEHETLSVKKMGELLYLDSGTLTPMLKRMQDQELVIRQRSNEDERVVFISLTEKGKKLRDKACHIPEEVFSMTNKSQGELEKLKETLQELLQSLHTYNQK
ncbi:MULTISPECIES: MarR family winged helix-turn-helix transcriptional regulator [Priestia]|uniref:MarR family winged helix-turn-helix transcriptional regulator n=1 Tax=Priestia TaxID=2800373 RepID=UPI00203E26F9|nr:MULTISPECIES: MarR family transcriptional regulator [Priestia]MCM3772900.1 MarR family transcriptional regulator [Priestia aryabhattai]MDY0941641.1 MarR family transcriptional regulator [Priestia megaterium]